MYYIIAALYVYLVRFTYVYRSLYINNTVLDSDWPRRNHIRRLSGESPRRGSLEEGRPPVTAKHRRGHHRARHLHSVDQLYASRPRHLLAAHTERVR